MKQPTDRSDRWYGVAWAAMVGTLCIWGMLANRLTLLQALAMVSFAGTTLLMAWLWQLGAGRAAPAAPLSRGQLVWHAALFVGWVAMLLGLGCWYAARHGE